MRSLPLLVTVAAYDGRTATLTTEGGHAFALSGRHLQGACAPGSAHCLQLDEVAGWPLEDEERVALSRAMLHEMLTAS
ncbi:MAG TPA: hypothetical protein VLC10_05110 [Patescibacteria group bacterium]|nr:hypothetical protein [Patescibacteria group bacterium]